MNNAIMENIEGLKKLKELNLHNVQKQLIIYSLAPNILKDMHKREKHFKKKEKKLRIKSKVILKNLRNYLSKMLKETGLKKLKMKSMI